MHAQSLVEMTVEHAQRDAADTVIRYEFFAAGDQTRLLLKHSGFVDSRLRDDHSDGWDEIFARLGAFVSSSDQRFGDRSKSR